MLDAIRASDMLMAANRSELIRLLILREYRQRTTAGSLVLDEVASQPEESDKTARKPEEKK